ncbi:hypothetical protein T265_14418, partial [Opisthorchis viverrini]
MSSKLHAKAKCDKSLSSESNLPWTGLIELSASLPTLEYYLAARPALVLNPMGFYILIRVGGSRKSSQACDDDTNNGSRNPSGASVSGSGTSDPGAAGIDHQKEDSETIRPSVRSEPSPIDKSVCPSPQTSFRRHTFAANFLHPGAYLHVRRTRPRNSNIAGESVIEKSPKRSKSVGDSSNIPSTHNADSWADYPCIVRFCINMCIQGWIALLNLLMAVRAIIVRMGFICFACVAIVTVVRVKNDGRFWLLCITIIPLLLELILAIKTHLEKSTNGMAISK